MKCISIKQQWANLIRDRVKTIETRTWQTSYRGPLAIHASLKVDQSSFDGGDDINKTYPRGAIIAVTNLVRIREYKNQEDFDEEFIRHLIHGPWVRFGWILKPTFALPEHIPYKGKLGLYDIPDDIYNFKQETKQMRIWDIE